MERAVLLSLCAVVAGGVLSACIADDSAPNRRGLERPPLLGGEQGLQNAEKRELEAPKREVPTGGKEFPGQTRLDASPLTPMVTLADMPTATQPIVEGATGSYYVFRNGQWVPATRPTTTAPELSPVTAPPAAPAASVAPPTPAQIAALDARIHDNGSFAVPGRPMIVPGTGAVIPPDWGTLPPLASYPHRPWNERQADYGRGRVQHNPTYWHSLFYRQFEPDSPLLGTPAAYTEDWLEAGWFVLETPAVPVLMFLRPPLAQFTASWRSSHPVYMGYLPREGPVHPAPVPGEIKYDYPFTSTQPATAPVIPSPLVPPPATPPENR